MLFRLSDICSGCMSFFNRDRCLSFSSYLSIFLVWAIGGAMVGVGIYLYLQIVEIGTVVNNELAPLVIVLIAVGGVLFLAALVGCCGACAKQSYLLSGFLAALMIACIVQFATVVIIFMFEASLHYYLQDGIKHSLQFYGKSGENAKFTEALDFVQEEYQCCGEWGWADYTTPNASNWHSTKLGSLPDSCCEAISDKCGENKAEEAPNGFWTQGCYEVTKESLKDMLIKCGSAVLVFLVVEIVAVFLNITLYTRINEEEGYIVKPKKMKDEGSKEDLTISGIDVPELPAMPSMPV